MRMMVKVSIPTAKGNALVRQGTLGSTIQKLLDELKPEAVYFVEYGGLRTGFLFIDMKDTASLPALVEPIFLALDASVEVRPCMTPPDLAAATPAINAAAQRWG